MLVFVFVFTAGILIIWLVRVGFKCGVELSEGRFFVKGRGWRGGVY